MYRTGTKPTSGRATGAKTTFTWTGEAGNGNFNDGRNWTPEGGPPQAGDNVVIQPTASTSITLTASDALAALTMSKTVSLQIANNETLTLGQGTSGALINAGTLSLNSVGNSTDLIIGAASLTVTAGGTIVLGNNLNDRIYGAAASDVLQNTSGHIDGGGQLGAGQLTFSNGAAGTVDANAATPLVLNTGANTVTNAGILEATSGGALVLESNVRNTGSVLATGANSDVYLQGVTIAGGKLAGTAGGAIVVAGGYGGGIDGIGNAVTITGAVDVNNNASLTLLGSITNNGTLALQSVGNLTEIILGQVFAPEPGQATGNAPAADYSTITVAGTGTITLSDNANNKIIGATAANTLVNDETIKGAGQFGAGQLKLINNGVIDATGGNTLGLSTGSGGATNNKLLEATGTGGLVIQSTVVSNASGTVLAAGGNVYLQSGTIAGGVLKTSGGGAITVQGGWAGTLDGTAAPVTNDGAVAVNNNSLLTIAGTILNNGTIALTSGGNATQLTSANATLTGHGTVLLSDNGNNYINSTSGTQVLDNVSNTIKGAGQLGDQDLALINGAAGIIDATGTGNRLILNTGSLTTTNYGLIEATGAAGLQINSVVDNSASAVIQANGAGKTGASVSLDNGTDIAGGTLKAINGGVIQVEGGDTATLDGSSASVTIATTAQVNNNAALTLLGTLTDSGTLSLLSVGNATVLTAGGAAVTLTGGGTIALSDNAGNYIVGAAATDVLTNVNTTISGAGQLGNGALTLVNQASGTIDATGTANRLYLNTGNVAVSNAGLIEATGAAGLQIECTVDNSATGTILANGAGGTGASVSLDNGADIVGGTLDAINGGVIQVENAATLDASSASVTIVTALDVNNNAALTLLGTLTNDGTLALLSGGNGTDLIVGGAGVTLTGGGTIALSDNANNYILGASATTVLTNLNNTINGGGQLGYGTLTLVNTASGTIDASSAGNRLYLNTGSIAVSNDGLIEATGAAGLQIQCEIDNGATGIILANGATAATSVNIDNGADIVGGTLEAINGGIMQLEAGNGATLDGSSATVTIANTLDIDNNASLTLLGVLTNDGTVSLLSSGNYTRLILGSATGTLAGGGTLALTDSISNVIYGASAADVLTNLNNTITGGGQLGVGQLALVNDAAGIIDATAANNALIINTASATVLNAGLIEATTGAAGLVVQGTTIDNSGGGTIFADGANVYLNFSTLIGGTLESAGAGAITLGQGEAATLDGSTSTVDSLGNIVVQNNASLSLLGTLINTQTLSLGSVGNYTRLIVGPASGNPGTVTLTGGGAVTLSDNGTNLIYGAQATDTLVNLNNTISGAGQLGNGGLVVVNDAVIDATGGNTLGIYTGGGAFTNNALLEATGSGGLVVQSTTISNAAGTILATGGAAGANVYLQSGTIAGGLLETTGGGAIVVQGGQGATLDSSVNVITNNGTVDINNNGSLTLVGSLVNDGLIALQSVGNYTRLELAGATGSLTGAGTITLTDNGANLIYGTAGTNVLTNVNNTIAGAGQLGDGALTLVNEAAGVIDATGTGNQLVINTGAEIVTNTGLIEATGAAGLLVYGTEINSTGGGTLLADGSTINLNGATLVGGTLSTQAGGSFVVISGDADIIGATGSEITSLGPIDVQNNASLTLLGTLFNAGTINIDSGGNYTRLYIGSPTVTLLGGGTITLSDNANNLVYGTAGTNLLNNVNNTISGAGFLGNGDMRLSNSGIIAATGANVLHLSTGSTAVNFGNGQLLGEGSGGLSIETGTYTNRGLIQADDGSNVTFQTGAILTNSANGTLTSGSYGAVSTGDGATLSVTGAAVTTDDATIILSGTGAAISFGGTALAASLQTIGAGASLQLLNGADFTDSAISAGATANLTDSGTLILGGGTFTASTLTITAGAHLIGNGVVDSAVVNNGTITISSGELMLQGGVSGSGTVVTANTGTLAVSGGGTLPTEAAGTGTLQLDSGAYMLGSAPVQIATVTVSQSASLSGTGSITSTLNDAGSLIAEGGVLTVSGALTTTGTIGADSGADLDVNGGGTIGGAVSGDGTVTFGAAITFDTGTTISAATVIDETTVTLAAGENLLNQAGNVFMLAGLSAPDAPHRMEAQVAGAANDLLTNAGTLSLSGGGDGAIATALDNTGLVTVGDGGTLFVTGKVSGAGAYTIAATSVLSLVNGSIGGTVSGGGVLDVQGTVNLLAGAALTAARVVDDGAIALGAGENLTNSAGDTLTMTANGAANAAGAEPHRMEADITGAAGDLFTNAGTLQANGTGVAAIFTAFTNTGRVNVQAGTLSLAGSYTAGGLLSIGNNALLNLTGNGSLTGTIAGAGTADISGTLSAMSGARIALSIVDTGDLALAAGASITNQVGCTCTLSVPAASPGAPPATDTTSPHRMEAEISGAAGAVFTNAGTLAAAGAGTATVAVSLVNTGLVTASLATGSATQLAFLGAVTNIGTIDAAGGLVSIAGALSGSGTVDIGAAGTVSLAAGAAAAQTIDFQAATGLLDLAAPLHCAADIAGFAAGDQIDLLKTAETGCSFAAGTLTVVDNGTTVASLKFTGSYETSSFTLTSDHNGGTFITVSSG